MADAPGQGMGTPELVPGDEPRPEAPEPSPETPEPSPESDRDAATAETRADARAESDREAATTLAEMASALADSAEPRAAASSQVAGPSGGLAGRLRPLGLVAPRRVRSVRAGLAAALLGIALILGLTGSNLPPAGPGPSVSPSTLGAAGSGERPSGSGGASATQTAPASGLPSPASASPVASAGPEPSGTTIAVHESPSASITFTSLIVDPIVDASGAIGSARVFSFTSDGPGIVSAEVVAAAPTDVTVICLTMDGELLGCDQGATPGMIQPASTAHSRWTALLISPESTPPTVDVEFTWPTDKPSIRLDHGRFQGYPNPDSMRTLGATFKTRSAGDLTVAASWAPAIVDATLRLEAGSGSTAAIDTANYVALTSISPAYAHRVEAGRVYSISLQNQSPDSGRPSLSATISFP